MKKVGNYVELSGLTSHQTLVWIREADHLEVGTVLEADGEMVQVVGISLADAVLTRGYLSRAVKHPRCRWKVVSVPTRVSVMKEFREGAQKILRKISPVQRCSNCGAPGQSATCRYCGVTVTENEKWNTPA